MFFFFFPRGFLYAMALSFMSMVWSGQSAATSLAIQEKPENTVQRLKRKKLDPTQKKWNADVQISHTKDRDSRTKTIDTATVFQGRGGYHYTENLEIGSQVRFPVYEKRNSWATNAWNTEKRFFALSPYLSYQPFPFLNLFGTGGYERFVYKIDSFANPGGKLMANIHGKMLYGGVFATLYQNISGFIPSFQSGLLLSTIEIDAYGINDGRWIPSSSLDRYILSNSVRLSYGDWGGFVPYIGVSHSYYIRGFRVSKNDPSSQITYSAGAKITLLNWRGFQVRVTGDYSYRPSLRQKEQDLQLQVQYKF